MRHFEKGRSLKQDKIDRDAVHSDEEKHVSEKAKKRFRAKPYEVQDVSKYLSKKYDIKKEVEP